MHRAFPATGRIDATSTLPPPSSSTTITTSTSSTTAPRPTTTTVKPKPGVVFINEDRVFSVQENGTGYAELERVGLAQNGPHYGVPRYLTVSPDGTRLTLAAGGETGIIDLSTGKVIAKDPAQLRVSEWSADSRWAAFIGSATTTVLGSDGSVHTIPAAGRDVTLSAPSRSKTCAGSARVGSSPSPGTRTVFQPSAGSSSDGRVRWFGFDGLAWDPQRSRLTVAAADGLRLIVDVEELDVSRRPATLIAAGVPTGR